MAATAPAPVWPTGSPDDASRVCDALTRFGVPYGLASMVGKEDGKIALRIFLLDNSGSTTAMDGNMLAEVAGGAQKMKTCTRWQEIKALALQQARMNAIMGTPTEFVLLNPPSARQFAAFRQGVDFASIDPRQGNADRQIADFEVMLQKASPEGMTPLAERYREIHHRISNTYKELGNLGLRIMVVTVTDGIPTSMIADARGELVNEMRKLSSTCPVSLVMRICCSDESVIQFYNAVDKEVEFSMDVVDDMRSEAVEMLKAGNSFFCYAPLIHAIREGGTYVKLLDSLDERKLHPLEAQILAAALLRVRLADEPLPQDADDPRVFLREAKERMRSVPKVYAPICGKMAPPVDLDLLRDAIGAGGLCSRCCF